MVRGTLKDLNAIFEAECWMPVCLVGMFIVLMGR